jgi:hypothetical protein
MDPNGEADDPFREALVFEHEELPWCAEVLSVLRGEHFKSVNRHEQRCAGRRCWRAAPMHRSGENEGAPDGNRSSAKCDCPESGAALVQVRKDPRIPPSDGVSAPPTTGPLYDRAEAPEAGQRKRAAAARNAERHTGCNWGPCETRHPTARPPPGCTQEQYLW